MKKVFKLPNTTGRKEPDKTTQLLTNIAPVGKKDNLKVELQNHWTEPWTDQLEKWVIPRPSGLFPGGLWEFLGT